MAVSAACSVLWLAIPAAFLLLAPWSDRVAWTATFMLLLWTFSVLALLRRMPNLLLWTIGIRAVLDPMALLLGTEAGFVGASAVFLADTGALLVALPSMLWTVRSDQGRAGASDGVQVRSYLLEIGRPTLAVVVALVASLAVALASGSFRLGTMPLAVVAVTGMVALLSLAALLAWNSKGL
jgi:hypothetical protein